MPQTEVSIAQAVLDAHGDACADLPPRLKVAIAALRGGELLEVRSDDPAARAGVPAWSRLTGHELVASIEDDERRTRFLLRRR